MTMKTSSAIARIEFPEKLYVNFRSKETFNTETYPLGFATPFGTDAAFRKRKETVDRWAGGWDDKNKQEGIIIDNSPMSGFQLDKVVSRYSTSNKMFRIFDPRGMSLEITSVNLATILLNGSIVNGVFQGDYVWGRLDGINWLISTESEEYNRPKDTSAPEVGDIIIRNYGNEYIYIGKYYAVFTWEEYLYWDDSTEDYTSSNYPYRTLKLPKNQAGSKGFFRYQISDKPVFVFADFVRHNDPNYKEYNEKWRSYDVNKTMGKFQKTGNRTEEFRLPVEGEIYPIHTTGSGNSAVLSKTKISLSVEEIEKLHREAQAKRK